MTSKPSLTNCPKLSCACCCTCSFFKEKAVHLLLLKICQPYTGIPHRRTLTFSPPLEGLGEAGLIQVVIVAGFHLFPFRTEKLSPPAPMVLHTRGRVGSRRFSAKPLHRKMWGLLLYIWNQVTIANVALYVPNRNTILLQTSHYTIANVTLYVCKCHTICLMCSLGVFANGLWQVC